MKKKADSAKQSAKKKSAGSSAGRKGTGGAKGRSGGRSRPPGSPQRARLEKELKEAIGKIDEEGLLFLLQQSHILIHNAQVDKLNRELAELQDKQAKGAKARTGTRAASGPRPVSAAAPVSIEESESSKAFFLTLGGTRKVMNLEEMRRLVRICYAAETKGEALKQLYTVFKRERGDVLTDAKISGPASPLIEGLFCAIRNSYQLKDR